MFKVGERVEVPPHFDIWMMGDRFGVVTKVDKGTRTASGRAVEIPPRVFVKMDHTKSTLSFPVSDYKYFRFLSGKS